MKFDSQNISKKQKFALVILGTICGLLVSEVLIRIFNLAPLGIPLAFGERPNGMMVSDNPRLKYVPRSSEDLGRIPQKSPGTFRIVVLGDSVGYGNCNWFENIDPEDTFSKRLEHKLNSIAPAGSKFEVVNLSVTGYNTIQESEYLSIYGLQLDPDLVVLAYVTNDNLDFPLTPMWRNRAVNWSDSFKETFSVSYEFSALFRLLWRMSEGNVRFRTANEITRQAFQEMQAMGQRAGFRTLVAIFPLLDWEGSYLGVNNHKLVEGFAKKFGFDSIDLYESFQEKVHNFRDLQGRCTFSHPDENGHELAAEYIFRKIKIMYALKGARFG